MIGRQKRQARKAVIKSKHMMLNNQDSDNDIHADYDDNCIPDYLDDYYSSYYKSKNSRRNNQNQNGYSR